MQYIIIWIVCGIGAAAIASSKGRSAGAWLLGGLLLGPIGLLIVGFMGAPAPDVTTVRKCPFCAETILREAKVCKHCGREVEPVVAPKNTVTCPKCGAEVAIGATWCQRCQHHMPGNAAGAMNSPKSNIPSAPIRTALNPEGIRSDSDDAVNVSKSEELD